MILIGQFDSPFVRRCGIAMTLCGLVFEHKPWSTFGEGDRIRPFNPLMRVPTLVLDDGGIVIDSAYILDWVDEQVGDQALIARAGEARRKALYYIALTTGFSDKCVALFYERVLHKVTSDIWLTRLQTQVADVLNQLEAIRAAATTPWLFGDRINHADIALGCAIRHAREAHGEAIDWSAKPVLLAHSERCEALPVFEAISQPFIGPNTD
ncbi:MAG: glutathione S-transferase family protein [Asticcacaulis sp.]|nr:glutathione S-transferase family protein [Asticcacaulis sp.]